MCVVKMKHCTGDRGIGFLDSSREMAQFRFGTHSSAACLPDAGGNASQDQLTVNPALTVMIGRTYLRVFGFADGGDGDEAGSERSSHRQGSSA